MGKRKPTTERKMVKPKRVRVKVARDIVLLLPAPIAHRMVLNKNAAYVNESDSEFAADAEPVEDANNG